MKKKAVTVLTSSTDSFKIERSDADVLYLNSVTDKKKSSFLKHNIIRLLFNDYAPSESMLDFLNLAVAVYSADQLVNRDNNGYLGWNRMIEIYLPVHTLKLWESQKEILEEMLSFLSGDKWLLHLRSREAYGIEAKEATSRIDHVSLFSGGLDSYIGAIDMLSEKNRVAFVGHHKSGPNELPYQNHLLNELKNAYSGDQVKKFLFNVQPEKVKSGGFNGESSQRARSLLFISLGLAVANAHGNSINLMVPENGLISLNVPLTKSRIGSLSTRTTHPYFFHLLNESLGKLGIENRVLNPYRFFTKGEMLINCNNQDLIRKTAKNTVSCSKPGHYKRWNRGKNIHCGHCTPCIIRRASMAKIGIDNGNSYEFDIIKNHPSMGSPQGMDCNAFKTALERNRTKGVSLLNIAISGPLPGSDLELDEQKRVYIRGMEEVQSFFQGK